MVSRVADGPLRKRYALELRKRQQHLLAGNSGTAERTRCHETIEWVCYFIGKRDLLSRPDGIRNLVDSQAVRQVRTLAARVRNVKSQTVSKIPLEVEVPLLHVARMNPPCVHAAVELRL